MIKQLLFVIIISLNFIKASDLLRQNKSFLNQEPHVFEKNSIHSVPLSQLAQFNENLTRKLKSDNTTTTQLAKNQLEEQIEGEGAMQNQAEMEGAMQNQADMEGFMQNGAKMEGAM